MNNAPDGAELLRVAQKVLRERLMQGIAEDQRYEALMVANAMAIAARELKAGDSDIVQELRMLTQLYGDTTVGESGHGTKDKVASLNKRLARDIRSGVLDGACAQGVRALLKAQVTARLRVSNPKYLKAVGIE
jgi:predicted RecA/RadA family phage recombinase